MNAKRALSRLRYRLNRARHAERRHRLITRRERTAGKIEAYQYAVSLVEGLIR